MTIDPIGQNTYRGLGVPTHGESVIRQQNSTNAALTLMHSAANTGRFLLGLDYKEDLESSLITDAVFDIDAEGGFRTLSGSTIRMELNSTGLFMGSTKIIDQDAGKYVGPMRRRVTTVAGATTAINATSADGAGELYIVSTQRSTAMLYLNLPATPAVGDNYEIYHESTAAGNIVIKTLATGDTQGFHTYISSAVFVTTAGIACQTSGPMHFRFTALTSGSLWAVATYGVFYNSSNEHGQAVAGSTTTA